MAQGQPRLDYDIAAVTDEHGIELSLPTHADNLANAIREPMVSSADLEVRKDLRSLALVTIDGDDAKDFDDAVFCEVAKNGDYHLTVAIADVSYFVVEDSRLDEFAYERGTSTYFPGMVLPMLPRRLSEDLCSLKPKVDRLCLGFQVQVSPKGKIKNPGFFECVIKSKERLTYGQVQQVLEKRQSIDKDIKESLICLAGLCRVLEKARAKRGGLQLELPEVVPVMKGNRIKGFAQKHRLFAHRIIEECMLLANICAAQFLYSNKYPFLYRVHPKPSRERVERLRAVLGNMGINAGRLDTAEGLMKVMGQFEGSSPLMVDVMARNVLRALESAVYTQKNIGHFGLGYEKYAHFTSPIRRYPDLMVHRAIKAVMQGQKPPYDLDDKLRMAGNHCTEREQASDRASFNLLSRKLGRSMLSKVGNKVKGVVSGMAKGGVFVTMEGGADGMLRFSSMKQYFVLDSAQTKAVGQRDKKTFYVGMELEVVIDEVSKADGRCALKLP